MNGSPSERMYLRTEKYFDSIISLFLGKFSESNGYKHEEICNYVYLYYRNFFLTVWQNVRAFLLKRKNFFIFWPFLVKLSIDCDVVARTSVIAILFEHVDFDGFRCCWDSEGL